MKIPFLLSRRREENYGFLLSLEWEEGGKGQRGAYRLN